MNLERKQPVVMKTLPSRLKYRAFKGHDTVDIEKEAEAMGWKTEWHGKFPLEDHWCAYILA
ncbi:hypothetical protein FCULG_00009120 [Fusarium culmorum]|uniref:Uncharacterized protein n=1 Tax=Fusarium culmorum TaxID=5516 RepID=A0A2T4GGU2_FUSCU|nr:hypothetical protein FCULG_00009120 [Fusarium culmorum]